MKTRIRSVNAFLLFVTWFMVALSGLLLYLAPTGPRSGWVEILLLTKREWGEVHFWFAVAAIIVTVIHLIVDWKAVKSAVRYLVSARRGHTPHE